MRSTIKTQVFMALLALIASMSIGWDSIRASMQRAGLLPVPQLQNIGIEHEESLSLRVEYTTKSGAALLHIAHEDGSETARISVPKEWQRHEVRGAELHEVPADESTFGFTKWPLPPGASFQFWIPEAPRDILVHNPSAAPLKIAVLRYNFSTNTVCALTVAR